MAKKISQLNNLPAASVASGDQIPIVDVSATETKYVTATDFATYVTSGGTFSIAVSGRLTTESGVYASTSDRTAQAAVYWTPGPNGSWLPLYNGTSWTTINQNELTLTLNAAAHLSGSVYDIFFFDDSGTKRLGTGPAWSSATARGTGASTTELENYLGFWVNKNSITLKNGASTYSGISARQATYLGSAYMSANAATDDAESKRHLYNCFHRIPRRLYCVDANSHTYTTGSYRAWFNSTTVGATRFQILNGLTEGIPMDITCGMAWTSVASASNTLGVGYDSTTTVLTGSGWSVLPIGTNAQLTNGNIRHVTGLGFHFYSSNEFGTATSNTLTGMSLSALFLM
jgi:hypothetical protein